MNITVVIASLQAGGAERVISLLASAWVTDGHDVTILTFEDSGAKPHYPLHPSVSLRPLSLSGVSHSFVQKISSNWHRVQTLRHAIADTRPDAIVSFIDQVNVLTLLAARPLKIPVVVSERIDPAHYPIGRFWTFLRRWTYHWAAAITVQTERAACYFPQELRPQITIIPNPILLSNSPTPSPSPGTSHHLLAMGRLVPQKGFDLLIAAFKRLASSHPDWTLVIHGEGPERQALEAQAAELGKRVSLPGVTANPAGAMAAADIFVLSSRFEGFPNVLVEAMAAGRPVIAADCPSGPAEIVRPDIDGLLFPSGDIDALTEALDALMSSSDERQRLGTEAQLAVQRFALPVVTDIWYGLLHRVTGTGAQNASGKRRIS